MTNKIAIFGIGPSGLAAAKAVLDAGGNATLFAKRFEPSHLFGCQYLHAPIPGYPDVKSTEVNQINIGTPEEYRLKVYGGDWNGKVSPEDFAGKHTAWDIRETYDNMYADMENHWSINFVRAEIDPEWYCHNSKSLLDEFDAMISTIPARALCNSGHLFRSHTIWANGEREGGQKMFPPDNTILCDGTDEHSWYRYARVFGYGTMEWAAAPYRRNLKIPGYAEVEKPLSTNCGCFPEVIRAGRYGRWSKGILVHHVYMQAEQLMRALSGTYRDYPVDLPANVCIWCGRWGEEIRDEGFICGIGHVWNKLHRIPR